LLSWWLLFYFAAHFHICGAYFSRFGVVLLFATGSYRIRWRIRRQFVASTFVTLVCIVIPSWLGSRLLLLALAEDRIYSTRVHPCEFPHFVPLLCGGLVAVGMHWFFWLWRQVKAAPTKSSNTFI
jgi:hypothetical protein